MFRHRHLTKNRGARGFSLLETVVAIGVVTVGLGGLAALVTQSITTGANTKYASIASMLASEKLEDLDRWPSADPHVAVTSGSSAGSLTADTGPVDVTSNGVTEGINYYDDIMISVAGGSFAETSTSLVSGVLTYTTTSISPGGGIPTTTASTTAPTTPITFDRRWLVEVNPVINGTTLTGLRRITVWVQSQSDAIQPPVTFQMSTVRP